MVGRGLVKRSAIEEWEAIDGKRAIG